MKAIILSFALLISSFSVHSSPAIDTLFLPSESVNIKPDNVYFSEVENPSIDQVSSYSFKKVSLSMTTNSSGVMHQLIKYSGESKVDVIFLTGGYHYVDVYLKNLTDGTHILKKTGRMIGYPENELIESAASTNKVRLTLDPQTIYELYVIYRNPNHEKIKISISYTQERIWKENQIIKNSTLSFWLGIFFGTLVLLSLINFIFYYVFKDGTYMIYVAYISTIILYEASLYGYFDQTWFRYSPKALLLLNNTSLLMFVIFYLRFLKSFLQLKSNYPRWNRLIRYLVIYLCAAIIITDAFFLLERPLAGFFYKNIFILLILPVIFAFLSYVVFSKRLIDRVFFTGSVVLFVSGLVSIIFFLGEKYGSPDKYLQIGIIIELVIFNIGLGLRSKILQDEKDSELQRLNASLEDKVEKRTQKINEINTELVVQRDQLFEQNETIERQLLELDNIRQGLEETVNQKTKELRQANEELIAQNAQLEQYAFITAHNLKAPVARLKGLINIFEMTNTKPGESDEILVRIKEASLDMEDVIKDINQILQIKNFSQQDNKEIDLDKLIQKICKRLDREAKQNDVKIEFDLKVTAINSIELYLESILYNLIYNAIKYHRKEVNSIARITSYSDQKNIILKVEDNGVGLDLDKYGSKVFRLYHRFHDHVHGKGIGLYLVKTQVEALDGQISVASKVGQGTEFTVSFPISA